MTLLYWLDGFGPYPTWDEFLAARDEHRYAISQWRVWHWIMMLP